MTTIYCLPGVILYTIFTKLDPQDLSSSQRVCRAWYITCHLLLLKELEFTDNLVIERFITSIDSNPNSLYLNAVRKIAFRDLNSYLDNTDMHKLLARFPNLRELTMDESFVIVNKMDDALCNAILKTSPKLCSFLLTGVEGFNRELCSRVLYNLRSAVREVSLHLVLEDGSYTVSGFGRFEAYLAQFPRLKRLRCLGPLFETFEESLSLIEKVGNLTELEFETDSDDENDFMIKYLSTKTTHEREQFLRRLLKIEYLNWLSCGDSVCLNSWKFLAGYLKGLKHVQICSFRCRISDDYQEANISAAALLEIVSRVSQYHIEIMMMPKVLKEYLPRYMQEVHRSQGTRVAPQNRVFEISIGSINIISDLIHLIIERNDQQKIHMHVQEDISLCEITARVFTQDSVFKSVDEFNLIYIKRDKMVNSFQETDYMYGNLLRRMPFLKKVSLDISMPFEDRGEGDWGVLPLVEDVTIRAHSEEKIQTLLNKCSSAFPNMKRLTLQNLCGNWDREISEYQLELGRFALEKLMVDMTTVNMNNREYSSEFFVVEMISSDIAERHLFRVSCDSLSIASINNAHLKGFYHGSDYCQVQIRVKSLKALRIKVITTDRTECYYTRYLYDFQGSVDTLIVSNDQSLVAKNLK